MISRDAPLRFLAQLAETNAPRWKDLSAAAYAGELTVETANSVFGFRDGMLVCRAKKPATSFELPSHMRSLILVGLLFEDDECDAWSLSVDWRPSSHAVLWRPGAIHAASFVLTSPTSAFSLDPEPKPTPWARPSPSSSGVVVTRPQRTARPPSLRMPLPPSMTRLHPASMVPSER